MTVENNINLLPDRIKQMLRQAKENGEFVVTHFGVAPQGDTGIKLAVVLETPYESSYDGIDEIVDAIFKYLSLEERLPIYYIAVYNTFAELEWYAKYDFASDAPRYSEKELLETKIYRIE